MQNHNLTSKKCVYVLTDSTNASLFDLNGVGVFDGGLPAEREGFPVNARDLDFILLSAPTKSNLGSAKALSKEEIPVFMNTKPLGAVKPGSSGETVKAIQAANARLIAAKCPLFTEKYAPHVIHKSLKGVLHLYVLAGDEKDSEVITKALASGNEEAVEKAAREHGTVAVLLWRPMRDNERVVRVLLSGTCTLSRVQDSLDRASRHLSFLFTPLFKSGDSAKPVSYPKSTSNAKQDVKPQTPKHQFTITKARSSIPNGTPRVAPARKSDVGISKIATPVSSKIARPVKSAAKEPTQGTPSRKSVSGMVRSIESRAEGKKDAPKAEIPKRVNSTTSKTVQQTTEKASNSARSEKQPEVPEKTNSTTQMTLPTTPEVTKAKEADNSFDSPDMNKLRPKDPLTPDSSSHDYENGVVHVLPPSGGALKRFPYKEGTHNLSNFTLIVKSITEEEWEKSKEAKLKNKLRKLFTGEKEMDDSKIVINQRPQREEAAGPQSEESKKENSANNSLNSPDNASPKNKKNIRKNNDKSPALQMQSTPGKSMATKKPIKFAKPYYFEVVTVPRNERMEAAVSAESLKEFISKIRSRVVILPSNNITDQKLQGLLAGKQTWCHNDHPCTVVPTHSSEALTDFLLQNGNQFSTNHLSFTVPVENQKATPSGYKFVKVPLD